MKIWALFWVVFLSLPAVADEVQPPQMEESTQEIATVDESSELSEHEALALHVATVLTGLKGLNHISVSSHHGIVTLEGRASSAHAKQSAESVVAKLPNVLLVQNFITTEYSDSEEARATVADDAAADRLNAIYSVIPALQTVRARVQSGVVKLEGHVDDSADLDRARSLASTTPGIVFVDDTAVQIRVEVAKRVAPAWQKSVDLIRSFVQHIPLILIGLILLYFFHVGAKLIVPRIPMPKLRDKPLADEFARNALRAFVLLIGLSVALEIWGISSLVAAFVGTAGVVSIGIGFAFKDVVENYLGGVLLGMRQPFRRNDSVDIGGFQGKVIRLTSRETVLMTLDGNHLTIPNATVFKSVLYNFSRNPLRRFDFQIGVHPNCVFRDVLQVGLKALSETDGILEEPRPLVRISRVGDYTLDVLFYGWVNQKTNDLSAVKSEAIRKVNRALIEAGIDAPEPMRRVTIVKESESRPVVTNQEGSGSVIDTSRDETLERQIAMDSEIE